jgi:uncharacterized protein
MIVYQSTKDGFLDDTFNRDIEDVVLASFKARTGHSVAKSEIRAWKESLLAMGKVLHSCAVPGSAGVAIEYGIPQTAKRIDFMLAGTNADKRDTLIVVELKQWQTAQKTDMDGIVRTRFEHGDKEVSHPSYQAWSYVSLLKNFNEAVYESELELSSCAYLHNYDGSGAIKDPFYADHLAKAPVFLKGDIERKRLAAFLEQHVRHGERDNLLYRVEHGRIRPSKGLIDSLVGMLQRKEEFVLIDDQKVVFETALAVARSVDGSGGPGTKQVVIVDGGPGTGKSVVAINLLVALTQDRRVAKYVTKNSAPRAVFERVLTGTRKKADISNLFVGSGAFTETKSNVFDALIVDEAHRLNEKSGLYGNRGTHQVGEIIGSSRASIFFIDEDQQVTWKDVGEKADIERRAKRAGAKVTHLKLASQFRCSGSDGYLAWLDHALGIRETANQMLDPEAEFDFQVFDSPTKLLRTIERLNRPTNKARMVAGYCWDWKSKSNEKVVDVVIPEHNFAMQWNLAQDGGLWIMAPESVKQIGCIHTCQGLEVDYIGVIVGPDLIVRNGKVQTRPECRSRQDQSIKGYKKLLEADPEAAKGKADRIIKNTYRTLMTRGMKGCYVFCTDAATQNYFRSRLRKESWPGSSAPVLRVADEASDL